MSDWGGTNSTVASLIAGCDLEMPGPPLKRGKRLQKGLESEPATALRNAIDLSCRRILSLAKSMNLLGLSPDQVRKSRMQLETSATSLEDLHSLRTTVASGHVLLKNSSKTLPLSSLVCCTARELRLLVPVPGYVVPEAKGRQQ